MVTVLFLVPSALLIANSPDDAPNEQCLFPGDCIRHSRYGVIAIHGNCAGKSAWRERYINTTPDGRAQMHRARSMKLHERVMRAYELDETQKPLVQKIFDVFCAEHREAMGDALNEAIEADRIYVERLRVHMDAWTQRKAGSKDPEVLRIASQYPEDDEILMSSRQRSRAIGDTHPFDWNQALKRIEAVLSTEQAATGRRRLTEQFPHGLTAHESGRIRLEESDDRIHIRTPDRWEDYAKVFLSRIKLDAGQKGAAQSILREMKERAASLKRMMRDRIASEPVGDDAKTVLIVEQAFKFDLDDLFEEYQIRLDALLTNAQRERAASAQIMETMDHRDVAQTAKTPDHSP